jgi:hypothetical protein
MAVAILPAIASSTGNMNVPILADGIFDWNEAVLRLVLIIAIPLALVAFSYALYSVFGDRKR